MTESFEAFAAQIRNFGLIDDPWFDGHPRFRAEPVVVSASEYTQLCRTGEDLARVLDEAQQLLLDDPAQLELFCHPTPTQRVLIDAAAPLWHGIARADVFFTVDGVQVTELNSDTPTGQPEAITLGMLAEATSLTRDASATLAADIAGCFVGLHEALVDDDGNRTAAIIYPTEFTEDLSLVRFYRKLLEELGWNVVLGSPYNLAADSDEVTLFGEPLRLILRHYKTDWLCERQSVWLDENVGDSQALVEPLRLMLDAQARRKLAIVNPVGSVLTQNKRVMAFCWERLHRFSLDAQRIIETILPYTMRLEAMHEAQLLADRAQWVIKSDFGAEGDEVFLGWQMDDAAWQKTLTLARRERFVAQRRFVPKTDTQGLQRNHGVFVVGGKAAGVYTRLDNGLTDARAVSAATLVAT